MVSHFFRVPLEEIAYVRSVLEGYDGLALLRVMDPNRGEIEIVVGDGLEDEAAEVLARLQREAGLVEIARPADWRV